MTSPQDQKLVNLEDCMLFAGTPMDNGYAKISTTIDRRTQNTLAHRASYTTFVGEIPDGLEIDHLCMVKTCINPDHLEVVTRQDNLKRRNTALYDLPQCRRGHLYKDNEFFQLEKDGKLHRKCRACKYITNKEFYLRRKLK